ncbi:acyl-CoA thioesterase [Stigmatella aurantiaca]|uniref:Thioesterase family protein n=1 Tax=Stigmatella aurantiaca (strain DW4/3-1) TaxID=378806 RepID=Q08QZ7_STIAD|nr:hotdog domain-containing protein [Stigmatella aurantiaca]ADO70561.1 Thioesterase family protein [Stigmatella aurantiaca DW4/3-1]EAU62899.1 thioesterase family protein [Stigmatella aurantiaca DW4/3-1]
MTQAAPTVPASAPAQRRRVEHVDTDASGVVHFSRYASMLETAGLEELERRGAGLDVLSLQGLDLRVRELRVSYRAAARFQDWLLLVPAVEHVGPASLKLGVKLYREGSGPEPLLLAFGSLDMAVVNRENGVPACLPPSLSSALKQAP